MNTKQVIVMRKFKGLRTGKYISQACHASMAFLSKGVRVNRENHTSDSADGYFHSAKKIDANHVEEINHWLDNSFRKIVCYVDSELELDGLHQRALAKGMISHMIIDNGATEFNGVKTKTCISIGPAEESKFFGLTDHLPLL